MCFYAWKVHATLTLLPLPCSTTDVENCMDIRSSEHQECCDESDSDALQSDEQVTVAFTASQHDYGGDDVGAYERLLVGNMEGLSWLLSRCFYVWQVTAAVSAGCDESGVDEDTCGIVSSVAVHSGESPRLLSRCFYEWQVAAALSAVDQENRPVGKPVGDGVQQFYIGDEFPESKKQGCDVPHRQVRCTELH